MYGVYNRVHSYHCMEDKVSQTIALICTYYRWRHSPDVSGMLN
jgi:hypothetical protein